MNTSEQINELAAALAKAQGQITPAKHDAQNPHLKNRYATLTAVWDVIRKPLADNGLSVVQVVSTDQDGMWLITRLMHGSGQYIEAIYPVAIGDGRGLNAAQQVGSALSYARRYSISALVGVVSEGDDDDGANAATPPQWRSSTSTARPPARQDAPAPPRVVEAWPNAQAQPANGNGHATPPPAELPGFEVWADWSRPEHAIAWGMAQGVFDHQRHAENAYAKVKTASNPTNARAMWAAWYLDVQRRIAERDAGSSDRPADPDGWEEIDAHGVDLPQFS